MNSSKLRSKLAELVPARRLATRAWLLSHGIAHHTVDNLVKRGQLVVLRPGVYANPGPPLSWQGVVSSLQRMGSDLVVGGLTVLELQGRSHYRPLNRDYSVNLYGRDALPRWANGLGLTARFRRHGATWLRHSSLPSVNEDSSGLGYPFVTSLDWGGDGGHLNVSTPERALFEVLSGVPSETSFEHAELLLDGLPDLSPRRINRLVSRTRSVKVKRLFFWLANRQGHLWLRDVREDGVDLGKGKRQLATRGSLNREYQITVPVSMSGDTRESY